MAFRRGFTPPSPCGALHAWMWVWHKWFTLAHLSFKLKTKQKHPKYIVHRQEDAVMYKYNTARQEWDMRGWEDQWFSSACAAQSSCSVETHFSNNSPILFLQPGSLLSKCSLWDAIETQRHHLIFSVTFWSLLGLSYQLWKLISTPSSCAWWCVWVWI